jgi:hypothetical protein
MRQRSNPIYCAKLDLCQGNYVIQVRWADLLHHMY